MNLKVLSVDDSKIVRNIVARTLRSHGCIVLEACNGEEGLEITAREKPDVIILDITMPVMDGVTMLMKLREDPELGRTPIIMLTAEAGRENVAFIARLGVRDYITKPFEEAKLIEKISRIAAKDSSAGTN